MHVVIEHISLATQTDFNIPGESESESCFIKVDYVLVVTSCLVPPQSPDSAMQMNGKGTKAKLGLSACSNRTAMLYVWILNETR